MKRISLGTSDFKEIIDNNSYFVDKTLIVKEFLEDGGKIVLIPRPRRFENFIESMKDQISSLYKNFYYIYESLKFALVFKGKEVLIRQV